MDNQNILRIVLCLAILTALFLPIYNDSLYSTQLSTWEFIISSLKSVGGDGSIPSSQLILAVCLLLVVACVVFLLVSSLLRKPLSVMLNLLPLLLIIGFIVLSMAQSKEAVGLTLQSFGTGFYIMFLSSFLMPFTSIAVTPVNS